MAHGGPPGRRGPQRDAHASGPGSFGGRNAPGGPPRAIEGRVPLQCELIELGPLKSENSMSFQGVPRTTSPSVPRLASIDFTSSRTDESDMKEAQEAGRRFGLSRQDRAEGYISLSSVIGRSRMRLPVAS